ncbi:4-hydroxythreonine-4-phosphate dehydrogenase [Candidatus Poribacteria bacterium]|nr:4-hydroxythreonine-4-phosphate dehydrogenase [Candidatus Poribacteria bacterium]
MSTATTSIGPVPSISNPQASSASRIGLLLGDPSGIGPELVANLLSDQDTTDQTEVVIIGSESVLQLGMTVAKTRLEYTKAVVDSELEQISKSGRILLDEQFSSDRSEQDCDFAVGQVSKEAGRYVLDSIQAAVMALKTNCIDALVFAPFNKQSMKLAGLPTEDELQYFAQLMDYKGQRGEINILPSIDRVLWTSRVTSHVPLGTVADLISPERIINAIRLIYQALLSYGYARPKIAVAGLNPHAGEGGLFGREEIDLIQPAIQCANDQFGIQTVGPLSPDTVFVRAQSGEFDAVVTMYHDQGQIAMKLMGFERGVTLQAGLPWIVTTPSHGTAFDIAGQGIATSTAFRQAFLLARKMISSS